MKRSSVCIPGKRPVDWKYGGHVKLSYMREKNIIKLIIITIYKVVKSIMFLPFNHTRTHKDSLLINPPA